MSGGLDGYEAITDKIVRGQFPNRREDISLEYAFETYVRPGFDIPSIVVTEPTGRMMMVIEGTKETLAPIAERAMDVFRAEQSARLLGSHDR